MLFGLSLAIAGNAVFSVQDPAVKWLVADYTVWQVLFIRSVVITIAADTHLIQRVDYTDREGNQTSFELAGMHKRAVSNDLFHFTPPAGVQVVEQ